MAKLPEIRVTPEHNYIAAFLTLTCNLECPYCINDFGTQAAGRKHMTGEQWVEAINRFVSRDDLPLTFQGGEPTLHKDFYFIVNNIRPDLGLDLLTNLQFDIKKFIKYIKPERLRRDAPYANIRASFHPPTMEIEDTILRMRELLDAGFNVGLFLVMHPDYSALEPELRKKCEAAGIDFRTKEFLGSHNGQLHGTFKWEDSVEGAELKNVLCRTTEILIAPDGNVYRCHHDLYNAVDPQEHILSPFFSARRKFVPCDHFGRCNPCDVKVKTNRFQEYGHTSVEVIFEADPPPENPDWAAEKTKINP